MRGLHPALTVAVLLAITGLLAGCTGHDPKIGTEKAAGTVVPPPPTDSPLAFGAWAQPVGGHGQEQQKQAVLGLEAQLGHKLAFDHFFVAQLAPVSTFNWRLKWDIAADRVPMISFGFGIDTTRITAGDYDPVLKSYAAAIRADHPKTIVLRYAHEMDGVKNQGWVHSGPAYIAAWKHVHAIFAGLPTQWVWSPNAPAFAGRNGGATAYWPGDDQVDWVAADGYNFYKCQNRKDWKTFDQIFAPFLAWGAQKNKPMMIAEFGSPADSDRPIRQAQWLSDAVADAATHPGLRALVYYSSDGHECDWRLDASPPTLASLAELGTTAAINTSGLAGNG
jgi:hypothetical protein